MHPFCCVSPIIDRNQPEKTFSDMPYNNPFPNMARPDSSSGLTPPPLPPPRASNPTQNGHDLNHSRGSKSAAATFPGEGITKLSASVRENNINSLSALEQREVKINDIVGNGICGVLYKWVNYGKGWRPRWFMLQDGVLSYYKIHGPDKITVSAETEKGCKVIGDESIRRIAKHRNGSPQLRRKPFGEIHLKVSSIRESRSDDKRFSIFTGTKRLHLRAETREDRAAWMDALQTVKDMFPRMSNSELMTPIENLDVSTEKLRQRLQEEGVSESAIQDSELIMKIEFAALKRQLLLLQQKQWQLSDTLRQLETEKVDLENTVVDESQKQGPLLKQDKYSGGTFGF